MAANYKSIERSVLARHQLNEADYARLPFNSRLDITKEVREEIKKHPSGIDWTGAESRYSGRMKKLLGSGASDEDINQALADEEYGNSGGLSGLYGSGGDKNIFSNDYLDNVANSVANSNKPKQNTRGGSGTGPVEDRSKETSPSTTTEDDSSDDDSTSPNTLSEAGGDTSTSTGSKQDTTKSLPQEASDGEEAGEDPNTIENSDGNDGINKSKGKPEHHTQDIKKEAENDIKDIAGAVEGNPFSYIKIAGKLSKLVLFLMLIIFVVMLSTTFIGAQEESDPDATGYVGPYGNGGGGDAGIRDSSCLGLLYPKITDEAKYAESINKYIRQVAPSSPLVGLGTYFVSGGKKVGINPGLVVAHAQNESTFATCGSSCNTYMRAHNAFGRSASSSQPRIGIAYKWTSWKASLDSDEDDEPTYIFRQYISGEGLYKDKTLEDYVPHYCAPPACDTDRYIKNLRNIMQELIDGSNGGVTCD